MTANAVDVIDTLIDGNQNFAVQATGASSSAGFAGDQLIGSPLANMLSGAKEF